MPHRFKALCWGRKTQDAVTRRMQTVGCLELRAGKEELKSEHIGVSIEGNENVLEMGHGDNTLFCE